MGQTRDVPAIPRAACTLQHICHMSWPVMRAIDGGMGSSSCHGFTCLSRGGALCLSVHAEQPFAHCVPAQRQSTCQCLRNQPPNSAFLDVCYTKSSNALCGIRLATCSHARNTCPTGTTRVPHSPAREGQTPHRPAGRCPLYKISLASVTRVRQASGGRELPGDRKSPYVT